MEHLERTTPLIDPPVTVCSFHTKHALESLHPNISVFRHPDHLPATQSLDSAFLSELQGMKINAASASKLPGEALKAIYGATEDTVLFWAHHEKLCLIDGKTAFMGGIDLCFGRWDTNQHSIADCHPAGINQTVFAGQEYNDARIMDFKDVTNWQNNTLDRTKFPRMGWSDLSICLQGAAVDDLREHFTQRWNFIYDLKYVLKNESGRYQRLTYIQPPGIVASSYPRVKNAAGQQGQQGQSGSGQQGSGPGAMQLGPGGQPYPGQGTTSIGTSPLPTQSSYPPTVAQQQNQGYQSGSFPPPPTGSQSTSSTYGSQQQQPGQSQQYGSHNASSDQYGSQAHSNQGYGSTSGDSPYFPPPPGQQGSNQGPATRGLDDSYDDERAETDRGFLGSGSGGNKRPGQSGSSGGKPGGSLRDQLMQKAQQGFQQIDSRYGSQIQGGLQKLDSRLGTHSTQYGTQLMNQFGQGGQAFEQNAGQRTGMSCQIVRSACQWSHGIPVEHSIANAYIEIIKKAQHFIYIENQFFITATNDRQRPVKNKIGAAIVERVVRAAKSGQKFKVIVCMPAIPAFAGDLRSDDALSTRAIMEYQYSSISRGGFSIYQAIAKEGCNPLDYIRFYNLRNYDRINASAAMVDVERQTGVSYVQAQQQYDQRYAPQHTGAQGPGGFVAPETGMGGVAGAAAVARGLGDAMGGTRGIGDDNASRDPYEAYHPSQSQSQPQQPVPTGQVGPGGYAPYHSSDATAGSQQQPSYSAASPPPGGNQSSSYGQPSQGYGGSTQSTNPTSQGQDSGYQQQQSYGSGAAAGQQHGYGNVPTAGGQQQPYSSSATPAPHSAGGYQSSQYSHDQSSTPVEAPGYVPGYGNTQSSPQPAAQPFGQPQQQHGQSTNYGQQQQSTSGAPGNYGASSTPGYNQHDPSSAQHAQSYDQQQQSQSYGAGAQGVPTGQQLPQQQGQQSYNQGYGAPNTDMYRKYEAGAAQLGGMAGSTKYDSVAACYMLNGEDIRNIPWEQGAGKNEIDAFVSEELYIHSKVRRCLQSGRRSQLTKFLRF